MARIIIQVPGPPVPKGRPRVTRFGTHTPARTREYEARCKEAMEAAIAKCDWPKDREYRVQIAIYRARRSGDTIGFGCSVQDAGNGVLWNDDRQISDVRCRRFDGEEARTLVDVEVV